MKETKDKPETGLSVRTVGHFAHDRWLMAVLSLVYWGLVLTVWGRTGDVATDAFNDLTTAFRWESGQKLYEEIQWLHGPMPPILVRTVRFIWGRTVESYLLLCALFAWAEWIFAWHLIRRHAGPTASAVTVLIIWTFFTFEPDVFARLLPVNFSSLAASVFVLALLNLLDSDWIRQHRTGPAMAAAAVALILLTKVEFGLAAWAALLAAVSLRPEPGRVAGMAVALLLPAAAYLVTCAIFPSFWEITSPAKIAGNEFGHLYLQYGGSITNLKTALHFLMIVAGSTAVFFGFTGSLLTLAEGHWKRSAVIVAIAAAIVTLLFFIDWLGIGLTTRERLHWHLSLAFLIPGLLWGIIQAARDSGHRHELPLILCALLLLSRTPNQLLPARYGAFYLLPALVLAIPWLAALTKRLASRDTIRASGIVLFALLIPAGFHAATSIERFRAKRYPLPESAGALRTYDFRTMVIGPAIAYLRGNLKTGEKIAVVPNEPVLYYATGALPAWPDHNYIGHLVRGDDEQALAELAFSESRFIVMSNRPYAEFGNGRAGSGFANYLGAELPHRARKVAEFSTAPGAKDAPQGKVENFYRIRIWEVLPTRPAEASERP